MGIVWSASGLFHKYLSFSPEGEGEFQALEPQIKKKQCRHEKTTPSFSFFSAVWACGAGGSPQANQKGRQQPQGLLETIAHTGNQYGHGKRVARRARVNQSQGTMEQNTLSGVIVGRCFSNRRMQTRMSGGVGRGS